MHSKVTCQIHGFDYDMFEMIRGYKGESEEETAANVNEAIVKYSSSQELAYAITYLNSKEQGANACLSDITRPTIERLASFFELLRKKTKSVNTILPTINLSHIGETQLGNTEPKPLVA
ncbi:putative DNA polymerase I [Brevibacillus phage SecTim467]|uniref:Putative DNA polymerase I n=2 Tax=Jenstvirus jenst TaxID=1982225 RepID=A0A0K2CP28_9CAUD|nr:DNA polymerase [Brevibacillus phage Jenst]ALA07265.1 putative DNA polymerase I [Brevibacillus phage Jenst]ALA07582.1 putative DNA polymerase I [Brevibacillus phage SecTim467]